jgi:hypothetical protein
MEVIMSEISFISKFSEAADSSIGIDAVVSVDSDNDFEVAPGTEEGVTGCSIIFQDQVASVPYMSVEEVKKAIADAKADKANIEPTDFSEIQMRRAQRPAARGLRVVK